MTKFEYDPFRADHFPKVNEGTYIAVPEVAIAAAPAADEVPSGSTKEVLTWVGTDAGKAKRALDVELKKNPPKKGLVAELNKLLNK